MSDHATDFWKQRLAEYETELDEARDEVRQLQEENARLEASRAALQDILAEPGVIFHGQHAAFAKERAERVLEGSTEIARTWVYPTPESRRLAASGLLGKERTE